MIDEPFVTVAVPCYNCADRIGRTVQAVLANDYSSFELLLVEGGSRDDTRSVLRRLAEEDPRIRVLDHGPAHLTGKRNVALREMKGSRLTFLDDDCVASEGLVRAYVEQAATWPGMMVGAIYPTGPGPTAAYRPATRPRVWKPSFWSKVMPWRMGGGGNFCVPRELAESVGGWDERVGVGAPSGLDGGEDVDFKLRVLRSGHSILVVPGAVAYHPPLADWDAFVCKKHRYARSLILTMRLKFLRTLHGPCIVALSFAYWLGVFGLHAVTLRRRWLKVDWARLEGGLSGLLCPMGRLPRAVSDPGDSTRLSQARGK